MLTAIRAFFSRRPRAGDMLLGRAWHDPELDAALPRAQAGEPAPGLALIRAARGDGELRALRVEQLAAAARHHTDRLAELAADDDPDALLWLGAARIEQAWDLRGPARGKAGQQVLERFWGMLAAAEEPLHRAAMLLPEDPVPWEHLQWHGLGMQVGRPRLDEIWEELCRRDPGLFAAHYTRAQVLSEKWYGSHQELLDFAARTVDRAPTGDPVTAVLPLARFEITWARTAGSPLTPMALLEAQFIRPDVISELIWAVEKWLVRPRSHPRAAEAAHLFGAAFYLGGRHDYARRLLSGLGDRLPEALPWAALNGTPARSYARARRELNLAWRPAGTWPGGPPEPGLAVPRPARRARAPRAAVSGGVRWAGSRQVSGAWCGAAGSPPTGPGRAPVPRRRRRCTPGRRAGPRSRGSR